MFTKYFISSYLFIALSCLTNAQKNKQKIDFAHEVVPLLKAKCIDCHGGEKSNGGFSMNTRGLILDADVIEIGKPEESLLMELILSDDIDERMPPPEKQKHPLTKKEVDVFRRWILAGLPWEKGITFAPDRYEAPLKPRKVKLPKGLNASSAIDYLIEKTFTKQKTKAPNAVSSAVFLRRLYLDVLGLPPTSEVREKFMSGKITKKALIDLVLNDNRKFAEHWLVFWNDLLRNEYVGPGYIDRGRKQITGWLYKSIHENKPYDTFVNELISPNKESEGFIKGIKWRGNVNASQTRDIQFSQNISQVFLGINMKCASCHDSFVNKWKLKDAYGLAAITSEKPLDIFRCDKPTGKIATPAWIFPELGNIDPKAKREVRLKQLAGLMTHPQNGRMQRTIVNRLWKQLMGRGIVHPVESMDTKPWNQDLLDHLANTLVKEKYNLKSVMRVILNSNTYSMESEKVSLLNAGKKFMGPASRRLTAEQFIDIINLTTGINGKPSRLSMRKRGIKGGQIRAVMKVHGESSWNNHFLRAVLEPKTNLQSSLGRPNRDQVVTTRPELFTTLEAINLANGSELTNILTKGSLNLMKKFNNSNDLINHVYKTALCRSPNKQELAIAKSLLGKHLTPQGTEDFLWTVFMLPEFNYIN